MRRHERTGRRGAMRSRLGVVRRLLVLAVRADRGKTALVLVLTAGQAGAAAAIAQSQRWLVNGALHSGLAGLYAAVVLGAAAHTLTAGAGRIRNNLSRDLSERIELTLSQEILSLTARIPTVEHFERTAYLDRLHLLRKGFPELAAFCWVLMEALASVVSLVLSVWLLWSVHPVLSLLAASALPWMWLSRRAQRRLHEARQASARTARLELRLHELCLTPGAANEIRVAGSGPELGRRADALWQDMTRRETAARWYGTLVQSSGWLLFCCALTAAMAMVAHLVAQGRAGAGDVVLVASLALQLRQQVSFMVSDLNRVGEATHIVDHDEWLRAYAARTTPAGGGPAPERLAAGITLSGLSFRYPGTGAEVLRDIDLRLPAGATVGLVGVNGAGKTTLVKLLTGMYRPDAGRVMVDGVPLADLDPAAWAARCAGAFQDFATFELPLREAVGVGDLPHIEDEAAVRDAVHRAGADDVVDHLRGGLDCQLGATFDGVDLSHGQWQRVALARGMMRRGPLLLVLDEPTAALDPQAEHDLFERFAARARELGRATGCVTVLVSHRFSTVRMTDHIVVLSDGGIAEQGSHDELLAADGAYARLYALQADGYR
ncbi:ABC transporter ATP-binding protein [Streptomyces sp. CA-111067]|uniref:ABC transporter ATP-binding protein n=1 Tax=Streptomyces sp. CA-111067 TaxID=3240046 RepID=UPI003D985628